jgi:hypothetical protein
MIDNKREVDKNKKRVKLFISWEPLRFVEGSISIPSSATRLSDVVNDERPFLSVQDIMVTEGWGSQLSKFVLFNKNDVKAIIEVG